MKKQKIFTALMAISILISTNPAFCAEKNIKPKEVKTAKAVKPSKQLKASVVDNKVEYINSDWWSRFHDPVLKEYVLKAASDNYDLKIASLKVKETQEYVRESFGKELPGIGIDSNFSKVNISNNSAFGSFTSSQNTYLFPLGVNYELDIWRKNRDRTIQTEKSLEAIKQFEKASYISLTSAVASSYFNVISIDKQISLQKGIVDIRKNILDLTKESFDNGLSEATDVTQADKNLSESQSRLSELQKYQCIFLNQLAILTGSSSDNSSSLKRSSIDELDLLKDLPSDVKSEIVQKRPDILQAEAELQKSRIDVNLARKDYLPNILISGQYGFNASTLSKTFSDGSHTSSFGVGLAQNIFTGWQRKARINAKKYKYQQMIENYQKTILTSFQEVNDSLASLKFDVQKNENNISRIKSEQSNLDIINTKYKHGALSYFETLQYKERLLSLEQEQIQSKTECLIDSLSFYKAVGGKL